MEKFRASIEDIRQWADSQNWRLYRQDKYYAYYLTPSGSDVVIRVDDDGVVDIASVIVHNYEG